MTTADLLSQVKEQTRFSSEAALFEKQIDDLCVKFKKQFKKITQFYVLFHLGFFVLGILEFFSFLFFFSFFTKSTALSLSLAALFMTAFSYFVLLFYFDAKKPEQIFLLRQHYLNECKELLVSKEGSSEYYLGLAKALLRLFSHFHQQEIIYYSVPKTFETLSSLLEKFSTWCHWKDIHKIKELLLFACIDAQVQLIKANPSDLEAHASLSQAFCTLYKHYLDPRKTYPQGKYPWISSEYFSEAMKKKFQMAAERAIEEFKILADYAPQDLWVHSQLAMVYHDLDRQNDEIQEYEIMLKISPQDREILFRLGVLYFQQGSNAKALRIYEQLKKVKDKKADELISFYDSYLLHSNYPN
jgi:tetratricopeptide (TPR) repeat protein